MTVRRLLIVLIASTLWATGGVEAASPQDATPSPEAASPPEAAAIIGFAAAEPGARVEFVEERFNELFDEPLAFEGYVTMTNGGTLVRMVERPFEEKATIDGDEATLVRDGRERRVNLDRSGRGGTYLRTLYALLRGDAAALERQFELSVSGDAEAWQLVMVPRERALRRWLDHIAVSGAGQVVERIRIERSGGAWQEMRLIRDVP